MEGLNSARAGRLAETYKTHALITTIRRINDLAEDLLVSVVDQTRTRVLICSGEEAVKPVMRESMEPIAVRAVKRPVWWAEPSQRGDGLYLVRTRGEVIADGLPQNQAMTIAAEFNLARSDAQMLARQRLKIQRRKSA